MAIHSGDKTDNRRMLNPFFEELEESMMKPMTVKVKEGERIVEKSFEVYFLLSICDAPARCALMHLKSYNSRLGCNTCLTRTLEPIIRTNLDVMVLRDDREWRRLANDVEKHRGLSNERILEDFQGIMGTNPLMRLDYVDLPFAAIPEVMHSVFLGVTKWCIESFLKPKKSTEEKQILKVLSERMKKFSFPSSVLRRMPREMILTNLKAMDFEHILFFGFHFFEGLMTDGQFKSFRQLAFFMAKLVSRDLTFYEVPFLELLARDLVTNLNVHFNLTSRPTINLHFLLHLPEYARRYGSLLCCSAYAVESRMGKVARQSKTATKVPEQLMAKMLMINSVALVIAQTNFDGPTRKHLEDLGIAEENNDLIIVPFKQKNQISKVKVGRLTYCSQSWSIKSRANNHLAKLKDGRFVFIINICHSTTGTVTFRALPFIIQPYEIDNGLQMPHMNNGRLDRSTVISFEIEDISGPCAAYQTLHHSKDEFFVFDLFDRHA